MKNPKSAADKQGRWTPEETVKLRRVYGSKTQSELVRIFGRNSTSIEHQAKRWQLAKDKVFIKQQFGKGAYKMPRWSPEEIEHLRKIYSNLSNLEVARQLDRSLGSVVSQANLLGLYKSRKRMTGMGQQNIRGRWGVKRKKTN